MILKSLSIIILIWANPASGFETLTLPKSSVGALESLLYLSLNGTSAAPVARSYDGNDWEVSPGKFTKISISCDDLSCTFELPALVGNDEYQVFTSNHALEPKDEAARFLEQITFGTTLQEVNSFDTSSPLQAQFATYINNQMSESMSLHRSYFRERAVYHYNHPQPIARPHHPCEKGARYRRYAFTGKDKNRPLQVKTIASGKYLLSVQGEPRTVVSSIDWDKSSYISTHGSMPKVDDSYFICDEPGDELYGGVKVRDYRTDQCQYIKVNNNGGNAIVDFTGFTDTLAALLESDGNKYSQAMSNYLTLSSTDAEPINNLFFKNPKPQNIILKQDLNYDICSTLNQEWNMIHYVAFYQPYNIWVLSMPPPKLLVNTIENPAVDGGGANVNWSKGETYCSNVPRTFLNEEYCILSNDDNVCSNTVPSATLNKPVIVCGSPGEIANNLNSEGPRDRATFDVAFKRWRTTGDTSLGMYRKTVWLNNVLTANDQLRQRVAWAFSQILVVAAPSIKNRLHSEPFLNYYDIMVRNAFGNYFDILKEITFNPEMAENLSFLDSKSAAYMFENNNVLVYPDENFAREIMQLFSIGYCHLHADGTPVTDNSTTSECLETYTNEEIMEYSRAWTGFMYNKPRGNMETETNSNHVDPMDIEPEARDAFPKLGLNGEYIGDKYPLCVDQPEYQFLTIGAQYRLLGGSSLPELQMDPTSWENDADAVRMTLLPTSNLYKKLCNDVGTGTCDFKNNVVLDAPLICVDKECEVDTLRVVEVTQGIFYEYIEQPCVEQAFYNNPEKVLVKGTEFCSDSRSQVASTACCPIGSDGTAAVRNEKYWGERMSYSLANERCQLLGLGLCENPIGDCEGNDCDPNVAYWTNEPCTLKVKVSPDDGKVAVVHDTWNANMHVSLYYAITYFNVQWENGEYPTPANQCQGSTSCEIVGPRCICAVEVEDTSAFTTIPNSADEILSKLAIGAYHPSSLGYTYYDNAHKGLIIHHRSEDDDDILSTETIFEVSTSYGETLFLKNVVSTVTLLGTSSSFRNPPKFMKLPDITKRDALAETDATLKQYFYHVNTAPFIVTRLIQRFGISNPSPGYVARVAGAFKSGTYAHDTLSFGTGKYGDLASTIAALLLDSEARNVLLDADPSFGSIREPLLKAISLFRTFDVKTFNKHPLIQTRLMALTDKINEEPFESQSVFSFFLPEFAPHGPVDSASLVAPEAQVMSGPYLNGLMNGIFTIIKYGVHSSHGGLFHQLCSRHYVDPGDYQCSKGFLQYTPTETTSDKIVDELAMLMTSGRLSAESRQVAMDVYDNENYKKQAVMMVQQIIASSPEFQTTAMTKVGTETRSLPEMPTQSTEPYKAVVFLFLQGGMDSYNMLVPTCDPLRTSYLQKRQSVALYDADLLPITATNQTCNEFGVHKQFSNLVSEYNNGNVLFFANVGTITEPMTRNDLWKEKCILYAHNRMTEETQRLDPFDNAPSLGIIGRLTDALSQLTGATSGKPYQIGSFSINGITTALAGSKGKSPNQMIIGKYGPTKFDPYPWSERSKWSNFDLRTPIYNVNKLPVVESNVFGSTWSSTFLDIVEENDLLDDLFSSASVINDFEETDLSLQLMQVAKLIDIKDQRGVDRDFFYVSMGGWDSHREMLFNTDILFSTLDKAVKTFWNEVKARGLDNNVVLVHLSEFGRSLSPNGGSGTDHGWGGNYFILGGEVNGGRTLGEYPVSFNGDLDAGRGRMIPTTSWDAIWNGIAQWLGVEDEALLHEILPNSKWDGSKFTKADLFN